MTKVCRFASHSSGCRCTYYSPPLGIQPPGSHPHIPPTPHPQRINTTTPNLQRFKCHDQTTHRRPIRIQLSPSTPGHLNPADTPNSPTFPSCSKRSRSNDGMNHIPSIPHSDLFQCQRHSSSAHTPISPLALSTRTGLCTRPRGRIIYAIYALASQIEHLAYLGRPVHCGLTMNEMPMRGRRSA